ncbi:MAG: hypothetical protein J6K38_02340 [Alistipes sp.]|nr:hypothetical protein [Alistipes sp.]
MKFKLLTAITLLTMLCCTAEAQTVSSKIHSRFLGYGIDRLYVYTSLQRDRVDIGSTYPALWTPVGADGSFTFTLPRPTSGYTVRNMLQQVFGIYGNEISVSANATLSILDVRASAGGVTSEYFGPSKDGKRSHGVAFYIYASNGVRISGRGSNGQVVDMSLSAGWNTVTVTFNGSTQYITSQRVAWNWGTD